MREFLMSSIISVSNAFGSKKERAIFLRIDITCIQKQTSSANLHAQYLCNESGKKQT